MIVHTSFATSFALVGIVNGWLQSIKLSWSVIWLLPASVMRPHYFILREPPVFNWYIILKSDGITEVEVSPTS